MTAPSTDDLIACRAAVMICDGCGSSMTDAELAEKRAANPVLRSCCPERKLRPITRADYDTATALRKAAEGMAEAARIFAKAVRYSHQLNTFDQSANCSPHDMVTTGDFHVLAAALAAYEATK